MLSHTSDSRTLIEDWVRTLLDGMTFPSPDRAYLDEITASEVADLAYIDGVDVGEAIAAHALFTPDVAQDDAEIGWGATASVEAVFPVQIDDPNWAYTVAFRAARPSLIGIGYQNRFPVSQVPTLPPAELLRPRIGNAIYSRLLEDQHLQAIAGPIISLERNWTDNTSRSMTVDMPALRHIYGYVDGTGQVLHQEDTDGLHPLPSMPSSFPSFSLQANYKACHVLINVAIEQLQPDIARMHVTLRLLRPTGSRSSQQTGVTRQQRERDRMLSALVLPHLTISLRGATALFPTQQYAETKQRFLALDDRERHDEATARLYAVRQSGCIVTRNPTNVHHVTMSPFGVFDTPREVPTPGPSIAEITSDPESLLRHVPSQNDSLVAYIQANWDVIQAILRAAGSAFDVVRLHQFQWDAIYTSLICEATGRQRVATVVRAPTGAGKTVVFMVNAAISALCGTSRSSAVLLFPTRLLNEDMFRRLTMFVYHVRAQLPKFQVTGGLLLGMNDP